MTIKALIQTNLRTLAHNKVRSFLTILGIFIGITAIILIISLGNGAQALILSQIQGIGSKTIAIIPGQQPKGPSGAAQLYSDSLKDRDLTALEQKSNVPDLEAITPMIFGADTAVAGGNNSYGVSVYGAAPALADILAVVPVEGRFFTDQEVQGNSPVAIIGTDVASHLFDLGVDPIGQRIKVKNTSLRIIGILSSKGQSSFINFDDGVIVPYTTAQTYLFGIKYFNRIIAEADTVNNIDATVVDITRTIRDDHNITDPTKDDFYIQTQADLANILGTITGALTYFLTAVAGISLVVGGVGIMNIMLVSVTERTSEIGLRKAIGATDRDILLQFLIEAVILTLLGGLLGVLTGALFSYIASLILTNIVGLNWQFSFPIGGALLGVGVALVIGLIFGIYPARQASKKSPIEALRYE